MPFLNHPSLSVKMQPQKKMQPYGMQVMGAKVMKRCTMLRIEVASLSNFSFGPQNNLPRSGQFHPLLFFNEHGLSSLLNRYFRDSGNERKPAKTAPGDHVSHQAHNREASFGQTQQDGVRRVRLGPPHA